MSEMKTDYTSNSHKVKDEAASETRQKIARVTDEKVTMKKKSLARKITENFAGDEVGNVGEYILFDVILPSAKSMISDAVSQGIERMLFGDSTRRRSSSFGGRTGGNTAYNRMHSSSNTFNAGASQPAAKPANISDRARSRHDFSEIGFETRLAAEQVIDAMLDQVQRYGTCTVSDLYDAVGIGSDFADNKWGWTDLRGSRVRGVRGGFILELPETEELK